MWHQGCCVGLGSRGVERRDGDECVVEGRSMGNGSWFEGENEDRRVLESRVKYVNSPPKYTTNI